MPKIKDYLANVGKSLSLSAIDIGKKLVPNMNSLYENNRESAQKVFRDITSLRQSLTKLGNMQDKYIFKPVNFLIQNIKKDLKTGDFHEEDRAAQYMMEAMFDDIMDDDEDFDEVEAEANGQPYDPEEGGVHGVPEVSKGDLIVAKSVGGSVHMASNAITGAIQQSANANFNLVKTTSNLELNALERQYSVLFNGFTNVTNGFKALLEFNEEVIETHAKNSIQYFEQSSQLDQERNAILKEMLEMQRETHEVFIADHRDDKNNLIDKVLNNGKFNLQEYYNIIKQRAQDTPLGQALEMVKMFPMLAAGLFSNPLKFVTEQVMTSMIDSSLKKAITKFDSSISGFITTALSQLHTYGKKNSGILATIAQVFGIKKDKAQLSSIDPSNYNRGAMSWNGIAQKALVEIIPGHLRRIEATLTGQPERIYDLDTGKWSTSIRMKKEDVQTELDKQATKELFGKEMSEVKSIIRNMKGSDEESKKRARQLNKETNKIFRLLEKNDINAAEQMNQNDNIFRNLDKEIGPFAFKLVKMALENNSEEALQRAGKRNSLYQRQEQDIQEALSGQGSINETINNSYNEDFAQGTAWTALSRLNNTILASSQDAEGNTLLDYGRIIAYESRNIRNLIMSGIPITNIGSGTTPPSGPIGPDPNIGPISRPEIIDAWGYETDEQQTDATDQQQPQNNDSSNDNGGDGNNQSPDEEKLKKFWEKHPELARRFKTKYELGRSISGISAKDIEAKIGSLADIKNKSSEEIDVFLDTLSTYINKDKRTLEDSSESLIDKVLGFINSKTGLKVGEESNAEDERSKRMKNKKKINFINAPQLAMATMIGEFNEFLYDMMFVKESEKGKDKNGKPLKGFWQKMNYEFERVTESFKTHMEKGLIALFDPDKGILKTLNSSIESMFGINIKDSLKKFKKGAIQYSKSIGRTAVSSLKDFGTDIKSSFSETFDDIKKLHESSDKEDEKEETTPAVDENKDKEEPEKSAFGKIGKTLGGIKNVKNRIITAISPGEAIIPKRLNPFISKEERESGPGPKEQEKQEESFIDKKIRDNIGSSVSKMAKESNEPGFKKFIKTNAQGSTGTKNNSSIFDRKLFKSILKKAFEEVVKTNDRNIINKYAQKDEIQNMLKDPKIQQAISSMLSEKHMLSEYDNGATNRENTIDFLKAAGFKGTIDSEAESRQRMYGQNSSLLNNLNQFLDLSFGTDIKRASQMAHQSITKNLPEMTKGGLGGAALSTIFPLGGPLMGAVAGSAVAMIKRNKSAMNYIFGTEKGDGEGRENDGLISTKFMKSLSKYLPDIKKYGTVGTLAGLVLPFGPLGGLTAGIMASYMKNNEGVQRFLFGTGPEGKDGLLSKDVQQKIKKAFPKVAAATIGGLFLGPFGIMGNAVLGASLGMISTTRWFKNMVLGTPDKDGVRRGGIAGAIRNQITDPLKKSMKELTGQFAKWFKDDLFNPLARGIKPIGVYLKGQIGDLAKKGFDQLFKVMSDTWIGKKVGRYVDKGLRFVRSAAGGLVDRVKGVGGLISKGAKGFEQYSKNKFDPINRERGYDISGADSAQDLLDTRLENAKTEEERDQIRDSVSGRMAAFNIAREGENTEEATKRSEDMLKAMKAYQTNRSNIKQGLHLNIKEELQHVESTGHKIAEDYAKSDNVTIDPNVVKDKILEYTDLIEDFRKLTDPAKVADRLQLIQNKLKEEEDNYDAWQKLLEDRKAKGLNDDPGLFVRKLAGVHKPALTKELITQVRDLLMESAKNIQTWVNTRQVAEEELNDKNREMLEEFAKNLGMDTSNLTEDQYKELSKEISNSKNNEIFERSIYQQRKKRKDEEKAKEESEKEDNSIDKAQKDSEKKQDNGKPEEQKPQEEKKQEPEKPKEEEKSVLAKMSEDYTKLTDIMLGKEDNPTLEETKELSNTAKQILELIKAKNKVSDTLIDKSQNFTDDKYQASFGERLTEGKTGAILSGLNTFSADTYLHGNAVGQFNADQKNSRIEQMVRDTVDQEDLDKAKLGEHAFEVKEEGKDYDKKTKASEVIEQSVDKWTNRAKKAGTITGSIAKAATYPVRKTGSIVNQKLGITEAAENAKDSALEAAENAKDSVVEAAKNAKDSVFEAAESAKEKTLNTLNSVKDSIKNSIKLHAEGTTGSEEKDKESSVAKESKKEETKQEEQKEENKPTKQEENELERATEEMAEAVNSKSTIEPEESKSDSERKPGEIWYATDAEGNQIAMTMGSDGTPMKINNKDNIEIERKHKHDLHLRERSTELLEDIAESLKDGAKEKINKLKEKQTGGLFDFLKGLSAGFEKLSNFAGWLLGLPIIGTVLGKVKDFVGKLFKPITDRFNALVAKVDGFAAKTTESILAKISSFGKKFSSAIKGALKKVVSKIGKKGVAGAAAAYALSKLIEDDEEDMDTYIEYSKDNNKPSSVVKMPKQDQTEQSAILSAAENMQNNEEVDEDYDPNAPVELGFQQGDKSVEKTRNIAKPVQKQISENKQEPTNSIEAAQQQPEKKEEIKEDKKETPQIPVSSSYNSYIYSPVDNTVKTFTDIEKQKEEEVKEDKKETPQVQTPSSYNSYIYSPVDNTVKTFTDIEKPKEEIKEKVSNSITEAQQPEKKDEKKSNLNIPSSTPQSSYINNPVISTPMNSSINMAQQVIEKKEEKPTEVHNTIPEPETKPTIKQPIEKPSENKSDDGAMFGGYFKDGMANLALGAATYTAGTKLGEKFIGGRKGRVLGATALGAATEMGVNGEEYGAVDAGTDLALNYGIDKVSSSLFKSGGTSATEEIAAQASSKNFASMVSDKASSAVKAIGKAGNMALDKAKTGVEAANNLVKSFVNNLQTVFNTIGKFIKGKGAKKAVQEFCTNMINKLAKKSILEKLGKLLIKTGKAAMGTFGVVLNIAFITKGFYDGYNRADEIFEMAPGTSTIGMKILAGVSGAICGIPLVDLILTVIDVLKPQDTDWVKNLSMFLSESFGSVLEASPEQIEKIKKNAREEQEKSVQVVDDVYQASIDSGNAAIEKAKGVTASILAGAAEQTANAVASTAGDFAATVADTASKAQNFVKEKAKAVFNWVKDAAKSGGQALDSAVSKAKELGSSVKSKVNQYLGGFFGKGKQSISIETDDYGRGDPLNISQDDPMFNQMPLKVNGDNSNETVGSRGCVPASVLNAMASANPAKFRSVISNQSDKGDKYKFASKFFTDAANKYAKPNDGIEGNGTAKMARNYGYDVKAMPFNLQALKQEASKDGTAISVVSRSNGSEMGDQLFGAGGGAHAVTLTNYNPKTNKFTVNDPQGNARGLWDANKIFSTNKIISANKISDISSQGKQKPKRRRKRFGRGRFEDFFGKGIFGRGTNAAEYLWGYLTQNGFSEEATAGILGNWWRESRIDPHVLESNYMVPESQREEVIARAFASKDAMDEYTLKYVFPNNSEANPTLYKGPDGHYHPGMGLAQWTAGRSVKLSDIADSMGKSPGDIDPQMKLFMEEMNSTHKAAKDKLAVTKDPEEAAEIFLDNFEYQTEAPRTPGVDVPGRRKAAREIFEKKGKGIEAADIEGTAGNYGSAGGAAAAPAQPQNIGIIGELGKIAEIFSSVFNPFANIASSAGGSGGGSGTYGPSQFISGQDMSGISTNPPGQNPEMNPQLPMFKQWDPRWGDTEYAYSDGGGNSYTQSGCGPATMAMVDTWVTGNPTLPTDTGQYAAANGFHQPGDGTTWGMFDSYAKTRGYSMKQTTNKEEITSALQQGIPVITNHKSGLFTRRGHYVLYAGFNKSGQLVVYDPNDPNDKYRTGVDLQSAENSRINGWIPQVPQQQTAKNPKDSANQQKKEDEKVAKDKSTFVNAENESSLGKGKYGRGVEEDSERNKPLIWNWAINKGLNNAQAAGLVGNAQQESQCIPTCLQGMNGHADTFDQMEPPADISTDRAWGLFQMTNDGDRLNNMVNWIKSKGYPPSDLASQLEWSAQEGSERGDWQKLQQQNTPFEASQSWAKNYERCGEDGSRDRYAEEILEKFAPGNPTGKTYVGNGELPQPGATGTISAGGQQPGQQQQAAPFKFTFLGKMAEMAEQLAGPVKAMMAQFLGKAGEAFKASSFFDGAKMIFGDSLGGLGSLFGWTPPPQQPGAVGAGAAGSVENGSMAVAGGSCQEVMSQALNSTVTESGQYLNDRRDHLHNGIDLAAPGGTPIPSPVNGKIIETNSSGHGGGYGLYVQVQDTKKNSHIFAHMSDILNSKVGQQVKAGDILGQVGNTGNSHGDHLHYGIFTEGNEGCPSPTTREEAARTTRDPGQYPADTNVNSMGKGKEFNPADITDYSSAMTALDSVDHETIADYNMPNESDSLMVLRAKVSKILAMEKEKEAAKEEIDTTQEVKPQEPEPTTTKEKLNNLIDNKYSFSIPEVTETWNSKFNIRDRLPKFIGEDLLNPTKKEEDYSFKVPSAIDILKKKSYTPTKKTTPSASELIDAKVATGPSIVSDKKSTQTKPTPSAEELWKNDTKKTESPLDKLDTLTKDILSAYGLTDNGKTTEDKTVNKPAETTPVTPTSTTPNTTSTTTPVPPNGVSEVDKSKQVEVAGSNTKELQALIAEQQKTNKLLEALIGVATSMASNIAKANGSNIDPNSLKREAEARLKSGIAATGGNVDTNFINPDLSRSIDVIKRMDMLVSR